MAASLMATRRPYSSAVTCESPQRSATPRQEILCPCLGYTSPSCCLVVYLLGLALSPPHCRLSTVISLISVLDTSVLPSHSFTLAYLHSMPHRITTHHVVFPCLYITLAPSPRCSRLPAAAHWIHPPPLSFPGAAPPAPLQQRLYVPRASVKGWSSSACTLRRPSRVLCRWRR